MMNLGLSSRTFICRLCIFIFPWQTLCSCVNCCRCEKLGLLVRGTFGKSALVALVEGWLIKCNASWLSHFGFWLDLERFKDGGKKKKYDKMCFYQEVMQTSEVQI